LGIDELFLWKTSKQGEKVDRAQNARLHLESGWAVGYESENSGH